MHKRSPKPASRNGRPRHQCSTDERVNGADISPTESHDKQRSTLETARVYFGRGWNTIPVSRQTKKPIGLAWQKKPETAENLKKFFDGPDINVGVQMGPLSNGLTDVDLDCREAVIIGNLMLPKTGAVFGRKSKQRSHFLYYTTLADKIKKANEKYHDAPAPPDFTKTGPVMLELRIGGGGKGAAIGFSRQRARERRDESPSASSPRCFRRARRGQGIRLWSAPPRDVRHRRASAAPTTSLQRSASRSDTDHRPRFWRAHRWPPIRFASS
jgi:Bifunctional DNA primase/polymerase, N-terminal